MKLSRWAQVLGISYQTAWRMFCRGQIKGAEQLPTGTIIVPNPDQSVSQVSDHVDRTVIYSRVSSSQNMKNLDSQAERLQEFCLAKGWTIDKIVKETGSGLNDARPKLLKILTERTACRIVVEHKDRLARFGFSYIREICRSFGCEIVIVNGAEDDKEDLIQDFISVITAFCTRIYGQRRSKRKIEAIIKELKDTK
jgi:predicted site-specific integrase-resolvase